MNNKEIENYNRLCAKFLDAIYSEHAEAWAFGNAKNIGSKRFQSVMYHNVIEAERFEKELKFHSDWNWIMEVRDKILSINSYLNVGQRFIFNINACAKFCKNENDKPYKVRIKGVLISEPRPFIEVDSFDEKEAVVQAINQFLIWYEINKL